MFDDVAVGLDFLQHLQFEFVQWFLWCLNAPANNAETPARVRIFFAVMRELLYSFICNINRRMIQLIQMSKIFSYSIGLTWFQKGSNPNLPRRPQPWTTFVKLKGSDEVAFELRFANLGMRGFTVTLSSMSTCCLEYFTFKDKDLEEGATYSDPLAQWEIELLGPAAFDKGLIISCSNCEKKFEKYGYFWSDNLIEGSVEENDSNVSFEYLMSWYSLYYDPFNAILKATEAHNEIISFSSDVQTKIIEEIKKPKTEGETAQDREDSILLWLEQFVLSQ